ncbi:MAG: glycosyltransferase family 25 protein [Oricola sp.]
MDILVINLDSQPDRLEHFAGQMAAFGLAYTRIVAADGRTLSPDTIARGRAFDPEFYPLNQGEIACFLSHRAAWKHFLDTSQHGHCCVFEDDIHFSADAKPFLESGAWFPAIADIVKLETVRQPTRLEDEVAAVFAGRSIRRLHTVHTGTGAYALTRATARLLLDNTERFADAVDQVMFNPALRSKAAGGRYAALSSLSVFQVEDAVAIQDSILAKISSSDAGMGSMLRTERRAHKRKLTKLLTEIQRPFRKLALSLKRRVSNAVSDKSWRKVAFR